MNESVGHQHHAVSEDIDPPCQTKWEHVYLHYGGVNNAEELLLRQPWPGSSPIHIFGGWPIIHTFSNALGSAQHSRAMAHEVRHQGGDLHEVRAGHGCVNSVNSVGGHVTHHVRWIGWCRQ